MATFAAASHGGDGGGRPPRGAPNKIPSGCQSSKPRKVRGRGKNINLEKAYIDNGRRPLHLELDLTTHQFVGDYRSHYIRCISNDCLRIPFVHKTWAEVPNGYKARIYQNLRHYFDIEPWEKSEHWPEINENINSDCKNRFKDRKANLAKHFRDVGGIDDVETAKENPPESHDKESWARVIDESFLDADYIKRCAQNKINRAKLRYQSCGGSRSLIQKRYVDTQLCGSASPIQIWFEFHFRDGKWVNDTAEEDWNRLQAELKHMEEMADELPVDEDECLRRALGIRRGWERGIGRKLRRPQYDGSSSSSSSSTPQTNERINQLEENVRVLTDVVEQVKNYMERDARINKKKRLESPSQDSVEDEGDDDYDDH